MGKSRIEAYTDAVIAILITIMVLEIKVPAGATHFSDLKVLSTQLITYIFSFVILSMYWNNNHNLFQNAQTVNNKVLWTNNLSLLSLSFIPFATKWLTEHFTARDPQLLYCIVLLLADIGYYWNVRFLSDSNHGIYFENIKKHRLSNKSQITIIVNIVALISVFIWPPLGLIINVIVLLGLWLIPDRQLESDAKKI